MRIVAGMYRSIILNTLKDEHTRPTLDKVKEAVFSSLQQRIIDARFLDLFSGSGAIGLEAKSRGAKLVVMNDNHYKACEIIKQNIAKCKAEVTLYQKDYQSLIKQLSHENQKFDLIYLDPPFLKVDYHKVITGIIEHQLLDEKGILIVESNKEVDLKESYGPLTQYKIAKYGSIIIRYYRED